MGRHSSILIKVNTLADMRDDHSRIMIDIDKVKAFIEKIADSEDSMKVAVFSEMSIDYSKLPITIFPGMPPIKPPVSEVYLDLHGGIVGNVDSSLAMRLCNIILTELLDKKNTLEEDMSKVFSEDGI